MPGAGAWKSVKIRRNGNRRASRRTSGANVRDGFVLTLVAKKDEYFISTPHLEHRVPDVVVPGQPVVDGDLSRVRADVTVGARVALAAHEIFGEDFERDGVLAGISKGIGPIGVPAHAGRGGRRVTFVALSIAYLRIVPLSAK